MPDDTTERDRLRILAEKCIAAQAELERAKAARVSEEINAALYKRHMATGDLADALLDPAVLLALLDDAASIDRIEQYDYIEVSSGGGETAYTWRRNDLRHPGRTLRAVLSSIPTRAARTTQGGRRDAE